MKNTMFPTSPNHFSKRQERVNEDASRVCRTELHLSWQRSVVLDVATFTERLRLDDSIKNVYLQGNAINDKELAILLRVLADNNDKRVELLDLSGNLIGDEGARLIGEYVKKNKNLKHLCLRWNSIADRGAAHLAATLKSNDTLQTLDLSANEIGDEGAAALADMLINNQGLKKVRLHSPRMSDETRSQLLEALMHTNFFLEELDLGPDLSAELRDDVDCYCRLNRAGRRLLFKHDGAFSEMLWTQAMANVSREPRLLHYFIRSKPDLFNHIAEERSH